MQPYYQLNLPQYSIFLGDVAHEINNFLSSQHFSQVFILTDTNTHKLCLPLLLQMAPALQTSVSISIKSGEKYKNLTTCYAIWNALLRHHADRNALLINLGGGVVSDIGGFCAAAYKRGIAFINIPTTLLAQVDASVGGKTGVDFEGVKNSIGVFANPLAVFIHPDFLATLPKRQFYCGFAEMMKHGLIKDAQHFSDARSWSFYFSANKSGKTIDPSYLAMIYRSIQIKYDIVTEDPTEKGARKLLNFGHTIGHGLESYSVANFAKPLLHGEAVLLGLYAEMYLSCLKTGFERTDLTKFVFLTKKLMPPNAYHITPQIATEIIQYIANDKKNDRHTVKCTLLTKIGEAVYDRPVTQTELRKALAFLNTL